MGKRKYIKVTIMLLLMVISNILVFMYCNLDNKNITLSYELISNKKNSYQLYYGNNLSWSEEQSKIIEYKNINEKKTMNYKIPNDKLELRFTFGSEASEIIMSNIKLSYLGKNEMLNMDQLLNENNQVQIKKAQLNGDKINIETGGKDSSIVYKIDSNIIDKFIRYAQIINTIIKVSVCTLVDMIVFLLMKKAKSVLILIEELKSSRALIWDLSKNDFKTKYAGSYLGITWAFINPIITILIYWFVFGFGLKAGSPIKDVPFIVWFMTGLIPWFFFQEALINGTNCLIEYSYLVKKVVFKISILPIVKIMSTLFVHLVFIGFLFIVAGINGFYPSKYIIQLIYYSFCTFFMAFAISYATCAIVVFFKDLGQIINILLQVGMWMTPIMWSYTIVPEQYQWIVRLNPMYYIVEGYRDTIINHVWFFERYFQTVYFWIIVMGLFLIGAAIFKKLKPHFADVL